jgi:hypothetical protein
MEKNDIVRWILTGMRKIKLDAVPVQVELSARYNTKEALRL